MRIPFVDLYSQHKEIENKLILTIKRTIAGCDFILGNDVKLFEEEFAGFCGSRYAVGVSSGTDALFLALKSLGIGRGDEVIVPAYTFIATAFAVSYAGATPVFVDIDERTYNIDVNKVGAAITRRTRAIIPVHLYGQPADMAAILKSARQRNIKVIEDACQAHGAKARTGKSSWLMAGGIGDIGCFSFYPSKNLGCLGDGGMLTTDNQRIYKRLLMLRDCGRLSKYEHALIGYNCRLDTLQAAVLRIKLRRLAEWNDMRRKAAGIYNMLLGRINGVITPVSSKDSRHVYHIYAIRTKRRNEVHEELRKRGVSALIHYPIPLHLQEAYKHLGYKKGDFPVAEKVSREIISLPMYPGLKENQIRFVASQLKEILE